MCGCPINFAISIMIEKNGKINLERCFMVRIKQGEEAACAVVITYWVGDFINAGILKDNKLMYVPKVTLLRTKIIGLKVWILLICNQLIKIQ